MEDLPANKDKEKEEKKKTHIKTKINKMLNYYYCLF